MVQKGRTTVWVDLALAERVEEDLGIKLSALASQALEIADSDIFGDVAVGLRTRIVEDTISETENELMLLERRKIILEARLVAARLRKDNIAQEWLQVKNSVMLSRYVYQLNQVIISSRYDIPTIQVAGIEYIQKIQELNPLWSLDIHVAAFRKEMERLS